MRQYAADQVKVSFTGLDITPGLSEGTFIQEGAVPQLWKVKKNGVGGIVYTFHPGQEGTVSMQILASSKVHTQLLAIFNSDRLTKSIVGVLLATDLNTLDVITWTKARILGRPPWQKGVQLSTYSWVFGFENSITQVFDPDRNVVGA